MNRKVVILSMKYNEAIPAAFKIVSTASEANMPADESQINKTGAIDNEAKIEAVRSSELFKRACIYRVNKIIEAAIAENKPIDEQSLLENGALPGDIFYIYVGLDTNSFILRLLQGISIGYLQQMIIETNTPDKNNVPERYKLFMSDKDTNLVKYLAPQKPRADLKISDQKEKLDVVLKYIDRDRLKNILSSFSYSDLSALYKSIKNLNNNGIYDSFLGKIEIIMRYQKRIEDAKSEIKELQKRIETDTKIKQSLIKDEPVIRQ
ncbi:MAG: hypothetical protein ABIH39_04495 [Candidatus Margulisiibacteriota bacterium]